MLEGVPFPMVFRLPAEQAEKMTPGRVFHMSMPDHPEYVAAMRVLEVGADPSMAAGFTADGCAELVSLCVLVDFADPLPDLPEASLPGDEPPPPVGGRGAGFSISHAAILDGA